MIVKVELISDDDCRHIMVFGNNYKQWYQQLYEYLCSANKKGIKYRRYAALAQSRSKWIGGGLKWCSYDSFPEYLMERDGRREEDINFYMASETTLVKLEDILSEVAELNLASGIQIINHRAPEPEPCDVDCRRA